MKVYIDYIFIQNLIIDFILLKETAYITKNDIKNKNAFFGALIASGYVVILIIFKIQELGYLITKIFLAFVIIYVCFKPKKTSSYIKLVVFFLTVSILNLGTFTFLLNFTGLKANKLGVETIFYALSLVISKGVISKMWKLYKREIKNEDLIYDVKFNIGEIEYKYKAFLDTGNSVYSQTKKLPIIFAETPKNLIGKNELDSLDKFEIQTTTLSKTSLKEAYIVDKITITKNNLSLITKAGIVFENNKFSKEGDYNMILNYNLYTEKMGGIKI